MVTTEEGPGRALVGAIAILRAWSPKGAKLKSVELVDLRNCLGDEPVGHFDPAWLADYPHCVPEVWEAILQSVVDNLEKLPHYPSWINPTIRQESKSYFIRGGETTQPCVTMIFPLYADDYQIDLRGWWRDGGATKLGLYAPMLVLWNNCEPATIVTATTKVGG